MNAAQGRREILDLLRCHDLRPRKRLGQHFLADPNVVNRIVREAAVGVGNRVVEIGAGTGTLTRALAATGATVVAYEIDEGLRPLLNSALVGFDVDIRFADALGVEFTVDLEGKPWTMVANLPYNVGTPLLLELLRSAHNIERFVVMMQREVGDRLTATPGTAAYGLPTLRASLRAVARFAFTVPPQVFVPAPDVGSAVITFDRIKPSVHADRAEHVAAVAFGQRRKMLRRSLSMIVPDVIPILEAAGIDPTARAGELSVKQWLELASVIQAEAKA